MRIRAPDLYPLPEAGTRGGPAILMPITHRSLWEGSAPGFEACKTEYEPPAPDTPSTDYNRGCDALGSHGFARIDVRGCDAILLECAGPAYMWLEAGDEPGGMLVRTWAGDQEEAIAEILSMPDSAWGSAEYTTFNAASGLLSVTDSRAPAGLALTEPYLLFRVPWGCYEVAYLVYQYRDDSVYTLEICRLRLIGRPCNYWSNGSWPLQTY